MYRHILLFTLFLANVGSFAVLKAENLCNGILWCDHSHNSHSDGILADRNCAWKCISLDDEIDFHVQLRKALMNRRTLHKKELNKVVDLFKTQINKVTPSVVAYHPMIYSILNWNRHNHINFNDTNSDWLWLEFGVASGFSINATCRALDYLFSNRQVKAHGFDTFTGLPERWGKLLKGRFTQHGRIPHVEPCATLHKGLVNNTLPEFINPLLNDIKSGKIKIFGISIDLDLYTGSHEALSIMLPLLRRGSMIHIHEIGRSTDEWIQEWEILVQEEARALYNVLKEQSQSGLVTLLLLPFTGRSGQPQEAAIFKVLRNDHIEPKANVGMN
jgi:hypothetical protein